MEAQNCELDLNLVNDKSPLNNLQSSKDRQLKVLLDARKLGDGGIGVYIQNLVEGILEDPTISLTLIGDKNKIKEQTWLNLVDVIHDRTRSYSFTELFLLPKKIDMKKFDLYHVPHFTLPVGVPIPAIVTIHDLIHINFPERRFYPAVAKKLIRSAVTRAAGIVAVSNSTLLDLEKLFPDVKAKSIVIPNSLGPSVADSVFQRRDKSPISKFYILAVLSNAKPHKKANHLIDAFLALKKSGVLPEVKLVLVGEGSEALSKDRSYKSLVTSKDSEVEFRGKVSQQDLFSLYRGALCLVVPSISEGFCLPALEAKAFGVPVVARPVPALKEILDSSDFICEDDSLESLKLGILNGIELGGRSFSHRMPSPHILSKHSFAVTGEEMVRFYRTCTLKSGQ